MKPQGYTRGLNRSGELVYLLHHMSSHYFYFREQTPTQGGRRLRQQYLLEQNLQKHTFGLALFENIPAPLTLVYYWGLSSVFLIRKRSANTPTYGQSR